METALKTVCMAICIVYVLKNFTRFISIIGIPVVKKFNSAVVGRGCKV